MDNGHIVLKKFDDVHIRDNEKVNKKVNYVWP
jgi:hypothetical protein